ncbi:ATP synthase F1 subunit delta [Chloroflexota bacterium]
MARGTYARRYSQAIFEIALERKELDRWQSDLAKMVSVFEDAAFMALLESPKFHFDEKDRRLSKRLEGISPLALNLVRLLVTRDRLSMIGGIADEYQRLLDSYRGIEPAEVIAAVALDDDDKRKLAQYLGDIVGKKVVVKSEVDPALIGGIVARIGGRLLDGSTRNKLGAMRKELAGTGWKR